MKRKFELNSRRCAFLQLIKPENAYKTYKKLCRERKRRDCLSKSNFCHFIEVPKDKVGTDWSVLRDYDEAMLVLQSFGVSEKEVVAADVIPLIEGDRADSQVSEDCKGKPTVEDSFFEQCGELFWNNKIGDSEIHGDQIQDRVLELIDCVIERKKSFSIAQRRSILGPLTDYLLETRNYKRWDAWVGALMRDSIREFSTAAGQWFPDWRTAGSEAYLRRALEVRCLGLKINALRHESFACWQKDEKIKTRKFECGDDLSGTHVKQNDNEIKRSQIKDRIRRLFRIAYSNSEEPARNENLVYPIFKAARYRSANSPQFVLACARLFFDWAKYRISQKTDVELADKMLRDVQELCEEQVEKLDAKSKSPEANILKSRFYYILANVCRLNAGNCDWVRCGYDIKSFRETINDVNFVPCFHCGNSVKEAERNVTLAVSYAQKAVALCTKGSAPQSASLFRMTRNLVRTQTFAARWAINHSRLQGLSYSWLESAFQEAQNCLCSPLGPDEKKAFEKDETSHVELRMKRKLEYEYHLRVQIESIVDEFNERPKDGPSYRELNPHSDRPLVERVKYAFCEILIVYCYLFSPKEGSSLARSCMVAQKWIASEGRKVDMLHSRRINDILALQKSRLEMPPDETVRCEILSTIRWGLPTAGGKKDDRHLRDTALWQALMRITKLKNDSFVREVLVPALTAFREESVALREAGDEFKKSLIFNLANSSGANDVKIFHICNKFMKGF